MKVTVVDVFVYGSMAFFWYVFYPLVHSTLDLLLYVLIPFSAYLALSIDKYYERKVVEMKKEDV